MESKISELIKRRYKYSCTELIQMYVKNVPRHRFGRCPVCGKPTMFFCHHPRMRESMICLNCNSCSRNRHVAKIIRDTFDPSAKTLQESINTLKNLDIYEASTSKPLRGVLSKSSKYVCSEYLGGVKPGEKNSDGILCEDLQNLSFENDSFDLVITEDVFEHIRSPTQAFREIKRILKPGGYHIFTIPFYFDRNTFTRIDVTTDKDVYIAPPVYHGDPLRKEGIIVYTDFGVDMFEYLESIGLKTELAISNYNDIKTEKIYDSYVFRSKKI